MVGGNKIPSGRRRWRWVAVFTGCIAVSAIALWGFRSSTLPWATAQPPLLSTPSASPEASPARQNFQSGGSSDYASRVVAYIYETQPITRQELGEYLIARHGVDKLPLLLNKKIIEAACRARKIEVTPSEVEASFAEELKNLKLDQDAFIKTVLPRYKKNLFEWKEDTLRPRLLLTKLCQRQTTCSEEEIHKAFESAYGEKIDCRMILWPLDQQEAALREYNQLARSEEAFAAKAKKQHLSELSAAGGKIKAFGHYAMGDPELENQAFKLRPGELSEVIKTSQGFVVLKCDRRIPADTSTNFEAVRPRLVQELMERKVAYEMTTTFQNLSKQATPQPILNEKNILPQNGVLPPPNQVIGYVHGSQEVTREELGEFLITRFGAEKLELLVNRRIIDQACQAKGISVSEEEIDAALDADLKGLNVDRTYFKKELLSKWGKSMYEWREDAIRPRLLLAKLAQNRATCTEDDLRKCFEAHYGEKLECRVILWPADQSKFALLEYPKIRDNEQEFDRKARSQASGTLAATGGKLKEPIGHFTLGDDALEQEAFKLQPGEVSILVGTPQGQVVIKCDKRIPPDTSVKLDQVRADLTKEVLERKVQLEMSLVFKELRDQANPRLLLKDPNRSEDLAGDANRLLQSTEVPSVLGTNAEKAPLSQMMQGK